MRTIKEQQAWYERNWKKYSSVFGAPFMEADPSPLYWIGFRLEKTLYPEMDNALKQLQSTSSDRMYRWLRAEEQHVTLALPGRPGKPYGEQDIPQLIQALRKTAGTTPPFSVQLGDINCFPHALFREVYSPDEQLFRLHYAIADAIPFSEEPQFRYEKFTPHMSLCYLSGKVPNKNPLSSFDRKRAHVHMNVSRIYFLTASDVSDIRERPIATIELGTGKSVEYPSS